MISIMLRWRGKVVLKSIMRWIHPEFGACFLEDIGQVLARVRLHSCSSGGRVKHDDMGRHIHVMESQSREDKLIEIC